MMEKYVTSIIFFGMMMLFSYVHECAHMAAAGRLVKLGVRGDMSGTLQGYDGTGTGTRNRSIFGNVMYLKHEFTVAKKMAVYMAGPAANIIISLAIYSVAKGLIFIKITLPEEVVTVMEMIITANLMLAVFNLFPFYPLDGGRAFVLIAERVVGRASALKFATFFSCIFAVFVFISGLYLVKYNLMNIILSADAVYFLYILRGEIYAPYRKN